MSNRTATLYLRVTTRDGKTRFCKPAYLSKGRLKPTSRWSIASRSTTPKASITISVITYHPTLANLYAGVAHRE